MRHRSRALLFLAALSGLMLPAAGPAGGQTVRVEITGLRSAKGMVRACMTQRSERFPQCQGGSDRKLAVSARGGAATLEFTDVAAGRYAIAVLHDENGNGKVDRALMLMPKEGYGFSRDAPVVMGPPTFAQSAFDVGNAPVRQVIRMRYML